MKHYWNDTVCEMLANDIKYQPENCLHKPPLEIALKVVGTYNLNFISYSYHNIRYLGTKISHFLTVMFLDLQ